jgi:V/A-type H+-transporting ATPase subunit I
MMFTTPMVQLFAVVLQRDSERVTEALLREGVMQFISTSEIADGRLRSRPSAPTKASLTEITDLRRRTEGLLHAVGVVPSAPSEADLDNRTTIDIEKENARLDTIESNRAGARERQRVIQQEILKLEDIRRQVALYGADLPGVAQSAKHSFIAIQIGRVPAANVRKLETELKDFPSLPVAMGRDGDMAHYVLISMKRDSEQIHKVLAGAGWADVEVPAQLRSVKEDASKELAARLRALTEEQKKLEAEADDFIKQEATHLKDVWVNLRVSELFHRIQANFASSSRTVVFTGWVPASKEEELTETIKRASGDRCYLMWNKADNKEIAGDDVPVRFDNPKVLSPFQMLVSNFGVPQYGTIDPTPFVMPLYLAMFGLMFADIGQGLVLAVLGALGVWSVRKSEKQKSIGQLLWLLVWCGLSSVFFGALFGSFFGMNLVRPLWFDFHGIVSGHGSGNSVVRDVYDILSITIYFGIAVIMLGLVFNWVNLVRTKRWFELVFDKGGVLGGWIYAGGIYAAFHLVSHEYKAFPSGTTVFWLMGLPALLLFAKGPYHLFRHAKTSSPEKSISVFAAIDIMMEWIVELLEIFSGYLSNTLSFMRVAGLGIAHVCLMISIFALADMTSGVFSIVILVFGNILVIALEGLSAGIQALRLNYYEFFTKFFHGTGRLYNPISLKSEL